VPSSALLFVPLVAGFIFLRILYLTRFISRSWESTRLVFAVGITGLALVTAARLAVLGFKLTVFGGPMARAVHAVFPGPFSGTLAGTLILAIAAPLVINRTWITKEKAVQRTKDSGSRLHAMLVEQAGTLRAVALTLSDGKVYVGLVEQSPSLDPAEKYVVIAPNLSGFRDEEMKLRIVTNYAKARETLRENRKAYGGWTEEHLAVVVRLDEIVSAHLFNAKLYTDVFGSEIPYEDEHEGTEEPSPNDAEEDDLLSEQNDEKPG
jgi:hypothetical protein